MEGSWNRTRGRKFFIRNLFNTYRTIYFKIIVVNLELGRKMQPHLKESKLSFSKHFYDDRQHRGIRIDLIELIVQFGDSNYRHQAKEYFLSEKSIKGLKRIGVCSQKIQEYEKHKNIRVIVADGGLVITVMFANNSRKSIKDKLNKRHKNSIH